MKSVSGYTKTNDDDNEKKILHYILDVMIVMLMMQKKMIHYILDIKKVMMIIMEKNNRLYVGYDECKDGSNEKRNNKLYIGWG